MSVEVTEQPTLTITSLHSAELSGGSAHVENVDGSSTTVPIYQNAMRVQIA